LPEYIQYSNETNRIIQKWYSVDPSAVEGLPNIVKVPRDIFNSLTKYYIVDNGEVREMTQIEKDALDLEETQAQEQAELDRITSLADKIDIDLSGLTLTKVDTAIDNIGDLAGAKTFLKKLCRYIIKFIT